MSGFDAAKMLSASDQRSKFRILDLNEESGITFTTEVLGQQQTFSTPLLGQVTDISLRREVNCETVSYTFDHFYESHLQAYSFSGGIGVPGVASLAIQYSETLKRVHEAITKNNQAVGTSTIWWGFYSIQLAPTFLLKLDPIFNSSINLLINQASSPTTEDHQRIYNQFVESFGTHYVSHVIMGGTAHLYTFMNSNYHSNMNYEETSQQISLMFQYKSFIGGVGTDSEHIYQQITEVFKHEADTLTEFHPPVNSDDTKNQTEWMAWKSKAGQHPVVINRTLSHIADLVTSNKQVEEHLRKTIKYYITNGKLPTLAQLQFNPPAARLMFPMRKPIKPIVSLPGLDVVGCGFDVLLLESKFCILDVTNTSEGGSWSDPYNDTITYSLPNGFFATNTPESLTVDIMVLVTSVQDFFRYQQSITKSSSGGVWGIGRKHTVKTVTDMYRRFYQDYYNLVVRLKQIGWYTLSVTTFPYPQLAPLARRAIDQLPSTFDQNDMSIWEQFFASYGTHLVVSSNMGGLVWAETWYEKCLTYEHSNTWIDEQVSRSFIIFNEHWGSQDHTFYIDDHFKEFSILTSQLLGGTESIDPAKWNEWVPTVKFNPRPISYRLIQLDEMLPKGKKRSALKAAIDYYLKDAVDKDRAYIAKLEADRDPLPPTKCSRNRVDMTKKAAIIQRRAISNIEEARKKLCPYVGYRGMTCTNGSATSVKVRGPIPLAKEVTSGVYRQLPIGVGTTLDITTGNILLPALEYTYSNITKWTNPLTNQDYYVPQELSLSKVSDNDQVPVAHVFPTAVELSNKWRYDRLEGRWLGGEFGHSKSLLDIYNQYFPSDQAIAITQHPTVLYRQRVENLQLNKYARAAVDALTKTYDELLYSDFLRDWGTHIIQQSLVGGMHEQQVLFKDCIFSFNGAITSANLEDYLKQDILTQTVNNSFYANRRKISVDQLIGGDITLTNDTLWRASLDVNPALLKIEEYIPWYDVPTIDADVKENLRQIIQRRTKEADLIRLRDEAVLNKRLVSAYLQEKKAYVGLLNDDKCVTYGPITLGSVAKCANGCATQILINSSGERMNDRPLEYFRDRDTGFTRAHARINAQTIVNGPRVDIGCSSISTPDMLTKSAHICLKCELIDNFEKECRCVCPQYPEPAIIMPTTSAPSTK